MANIEILRSIDIEDVVRVALKDYFTVYCRPLPAKFSTPSLLIQQVGGSEEDKVDTFDVVIDARAKEEAEAYELLRNAIGVLKEVGRQQTTAIRHVSINSMGSWGTDLVRPDLCMCSARLRVVAHQEIKTIKSKTNRRI